MKVIKLFVDCDYFGKEEVPIKLWTVNDKPIEFPRPYLTYPDGEKVYWKNERYSHRTLSNGETIYRK